MNTLNLNDFQLEEYQKYLDQPGIIERIRNPNKIPTEHSVGENIIATIKMQNNFWYHLKMVIFPILR